MITYCPRCGAPYREDLRGEWFETGLRCDDCGLKVTEPPALLVRGHEDEVEYDLRDWEMTERASATTALVGADIPYRWEPSLVLVVPAVAEEEVDLLLDELDEPGQLEESGDAGEGADGGEEAHGAMVDLFLAADRLQRDTAAAAVTAEVLDAASTVHACLPPYGIERAVWRRIQALAATVATDLEEAADEDTVAADARALREYLRDLV
jgi:hypothetical protein